MRKAEIIEALRAQVRELKRANKDIRMRLAKAAEDEGRALEETQRLYKQRDSLERNFNARVSELQDANDALLKQLEERTKERDSWRLLEQEATAERDALRDERNYLQEIVDERDAIITESDRLTEELEELTAERDALRAELDALRQQPPAREAKPTCMVRGCSEPRPPYITRQGVLMGWQPLCEAHHSKDVAEFPDVRLWLWCNHQGCYSVRPAGTESCGQHGGRDLTPEDLAPLEDAPPQGEGKEGRDGPV